MMLSRSRPFVVRARRRLGMLLAEHSGYARSRAFLRRQALEGRETARLRWDGATAEIEVGGRSFFLRSDFMQDRPEICDFALFALAAVSSRTNCEIAVDFPVSRSAARRMEQLEYAYTVWSLSSLAPPRLRPSVVVDTPPPAPTGRRAICLSGGLDSTAAAIAARRRGYTHSVLIAGADYPSAAHPGFVELQGRVRRLSELLDLEPVTVETDFRRMPIDWELQHSFLLATALQFHAEVFDEASWGLDLTLMDEPVLHPWGNMSVLQALCSTETLPIATLNPFETRRDKARMIAEFVPEAAGSEAGAGALIPHLSVCWVDQSTGGNCGRCFKCARTKLIFDTLGVDASAMFATPPDTGKVLADTSVPRRMSKLRLQIALTTGLYFALPDGPVRRRLMEQTRRMQVKYVRAMPYR